MTKLSFSALFSILFFVAGAQTPYQRVYSTLNTKCQNSSCHSATSNGDNLKFDGDPNQVYQQIFKVPSALFPSSVAKFDQLIKPQTANNSFLLKKVAGAQFDTDLALDSTEGNLMLDTAGQTLNKVEIEYVRQWIRCGAKQNYDTTEVQPDYAVIYQYYNDTAILPFLPKPPKPAPGTGYQLRMGPVFLPVTGDVEQELMQQQEVNFPFLPEVYEIDGYMNQQSHHFLLFSYPDSVTATTNTADTSDMARVNVGLSNINGISSFCCNKNLTGAWQTDQNLVLPQGTGMMWAQKTYLDLDFHVKNYNATTVLPCDFYLNVYYRPKSATTIPMISHLVNNPTLIMQQGINNRLYDDNFNGNNARVRYLWMASGHTHAMGTAFYIIRRDTAGLLADTIYDGSFDYANNAPIGFWDHSHPPLEYWPELKPIQFGKHNGNKSGLVASATYNVTVPAVTFGETTNDEMELFYYMYTTTPLAGTSAINDPSPKTVYMDIMPNPMSGNGRLVYTLDNPARIEASIIDITGKSIAQVGEENEEAGVHEIAIGNGQQLAKGIYIARLSIDGIVYAKKFIVAE
ncbi:MAG: hypothetical protein JWO06_3681 [Bacteroidota bacterium]|nr:hypothetical protein [Bacteroidota bacterium]